MRARTAFAWALLASALALLLPAPVAAARTFVLEVEPDASYVNLGQGQTVSVVATEAGLPAGGVGIEFDFGGQKTVQFTDDQGHASLGLYQGMNASLGEVKVHAVSAFGPEGPEQAESNVVTKRLLWTQILLNLTGPPGLTPGGEGAPFVATASWAHDGSPVVGLRLHFLGPSDQAAFTDADGQATVYFTRATGGILGVAADVKPQDYPQGIWTGGIAAVRAEFTEGNGSSPVAQPPQDVVVIGAADGDETPAPGDADGDFVPDAFDAFPSDSSAAVDTDGNGRPDRQDRQRVVLPLAVDGPPDGPTPRGGRGSAAWLWGAAACAVLAAAAWLASRRRRP